tara:strand:- start:13764 stop:15368 length:1605 start_codon:yes stop_codon:yes gene_type:complete
MTATAEYNAGTRNLTVDGDGLPNPVLYGTFPNANNPNQVTEQDFEHTFYYRGGTFGVTRTFDDNTFVHDGFFIQIPLSVADNTLLGSAIRVGDRILFVFDENTVNERKQVFVYKGTEQTATAGEFWRASDQYLELIMDFQRSGYNGTYEYYDQRNGRSETPLGAIGVAANGVVFFNPSAGAGGNPPTGFQWNAHFEGSPVNFGDDNCGGHPEVTGQYHYHDTEFLGCWKADSVMASYNDYYGASQYNGDNLRHPDGHSKILGYAFDGFPVYGPYMYTDPWNNDSDIGLATSSYRVKSEEAENRPSYGDSQQNPPAGALMADWEYAEGLGNLDYHNGRFCITPEFQDGTYAYFLSTELDSEQNLLPVFPYLVGLTSREVLNQPPNNGAATPPPPDQGGGGNVAPATIQITNQPQNATHNVGQTVTFSIAATISPEDGPKAYQWFRSTDGGFSFAVLTGATNSSYQFTALNYMSGYKFRCEVRGPLGLGITPATNSPLTSDVVTLTVTGIGDGQGDTDFSSTDSKFDTTTISFDAT